MKYLYLCFAISLLVVAGCGQRLENSIYDTATNPDSLPAMACELLDQIAFGQITTADSVTAGFNQLYTQHSELFENDSWRALITKLGPLFTAQADSLATLGAENYAEAARYYLLSSLARPEDSSARDKANLFDGWLSAVDKLPNSTFASESGPTTDEIIRVTRYLTLGDTVQQRFRREYLIESYLDSLVELAADDGIALVPADRAWLTWIGSVEVDSFEALGSFGETPIVLVAHQAVPWGDEGVMIELYFRSDNDVEDFESVIPDLGPDGSEMFLPLRRSPGSSDLWLANGLISVMRPFQVLSVGLRDASDGYLALSGTTDQWYVTIALSDHTSIP